MYGSLALQLIFIGSGIIEIIPDPDCAPGANVDSAIVRSFPMRVVCGHMGCGAVGQLRDDLLTERVKCPLCGSVFTLMGQNTRPEGCQERSAYGWTAYPGGEIADLKAAVEDCLSSQAPHQAVEELRERQTNLGDQQKPTDRFENEASNFVLVGSPYTPHRRITWIERAIDRTLDIFLMPLAWTRRLLGRKGARSSHDREVEVDVSIGLNQIVTERDQVSTAKRVDPGERTADRSVRSVRLVVASEAFALTKGTVLLAPKQLISSFDKQLTDACQINNGDLIRYISENGWGEPVCLASPPAREEIDKIARTIAPKGNWVFASATAETLGTFYGLVVAFGSSRPRFTSRGTVGAPQPAVCAGATKSVVELRTKLGSAATSGFFIFDYTRMDTLYGAQAYRAIRDSLRSSPGICAFNDGDISRATVRSLAEHALLVLNADEEVLIPHDTTSFGPYLLAMWTNEGRNFERIHCWLSQHRVAGYRGCIILQGQHEHVAFTQAMSSELHLPAGIVFANGEAVPETSKWGIS
jgi:hypothetical protein